MKSAWMTVMGFYRFTKSKVTLLLCILIYIVYHAVSYRDQLFYTDSLKGKFPADVPVTEPVMIYFNTWGMRPNEVFYPCSIAIYKISDAAAEEIKERGVSYFKKGEQFRQLPYWLSKRPSRKTHVTYGEWATTPVPSDWTSEGSWFMCWPGRDNVPSELNNLIYAARKHGSFYTQSIDSTSQIVISPELKLAVYSFFED